MTTENVQTMPAQAVGCDPLRPEIKGFDGAFAWISLALGYLFVKFVFTDVNGFAETGICITTFICGALYVIKCGKKVTFSQWMLGAVICAFSVMFSISASAFINTLCFWFLTAAQFWWVQAVCIQARFVTKYFVPDLMLTVFIQPLRDLGGFFRAAFLSMRNGKRSGTIKAVIIGLTVTVPLTLAVAVLLAEADNNMDLMLGKFIDTLRHYQLFHELLQALFAVPVGMLIFGMLRADAKQKLYPLPSDVSYNEKAQKLKKLDNVGIYAGVTPVCVLYVIYIVSQTSYFLSAFSGKLPDSMSYAQYARRGFFELCMIAVINLAVILFMLTFSKKSGSSATKPLRFFTCMICGFTLFIISTAIAKMLLYVDAYGLTLLRLYTTWFMVLLGITFAVLAVRAFVTKLPTAKILSASFIVMFALLCFSRPDALIAEYNISRYEEGTLEKLDVGMLCNMSDDAYAVMIDHRDAISRAGYSAEFDNRLSYLLDYYDSDPGSAMNYSAQKILSECGERGRCA